MKKELELDDLKKVTGGISTTNCAYFVQALRMPNDNKCENCRYYNEVENGEYDCSHPSVTK